jgi:hypothetical protein
MPMESESPSIVIWFSVKPPRYITRKVGINEHGIASAMMIVSRTLRRKSQTTPTASSAPSTRLLLMSSRASLT